MAEITYPFLYSENLNGLEIISRGLKQQKKFFDAGEYGMTWVPADDTALAGAITKGNNIRTSDFFVSPIFDSCVENPPCPWDKSGNDNLKESELMPIIAPNDGVSTYRFVSTKEKIMEPHPMNGRGSSLITLKIKVNCQQINVPISLFLITVVK